MEEISRYILRNYRWGVYLVEVRALTEDEIYVSVYWHKTEISVDILEYLR
jgi:hypothetical protein